MRDFNLEKLDKKDKMIMNALENNSRASFKEIGKNVGLSGENAEYRIERMLKNGLISRMFAEPNLSKLGLKTYRIYLKIENTTEKNEREIFDYFANHPRARWYAEFEGEWDYTIRYALEKEAQLKEELDALTVRFGQFIKAKDIVITSYQMYLPITYFTGGERTLRELYMVDSLEKADPFDLKILSALCNNSRTKTVDIAKEIGISPDAVQYRLRKLVESKVISFFTAWFDRRKFGYEYYKVLIWLQYATIRDEKKLIAYCQQHPNAVYINRVMGNWDLEVDFDARNAVEIHEIVKSLKNRFAGIIRDHTTLTILRDGIPGQAKIL